MMILNLLSIEIEKNYMTKQKTVSRRIFLLTFKNLKKSDVEHLHDLLLTF